MEEYYSTTHVNPAKSSDVLLMVNEEKTEALLYIWRKDSESGNISVPLDLFKGKNLQFELIYPANDEYKINFAYDSENRLFNAEINKKNTARLIKISVAEYV